MANTTIVSSEFSFRKVKESGYKRPNVSVQFEAPTADGIVTLLQSGEEKTKALVVETIQGLLSSYIRSYVDQDLSFTQATLDGLAGEGKLSLDYLANLPKADRNVLSKEDLEKFAEDYITVMPGITGKPVDRVQAAANLFVERFRRAAGDDTVLKILQDQLMVFAEHAPEEVITRNERVLTWAVSKLEELLSIKITADAL